MQETLIKCNRAQNKLLKVKRIRKDNMKSIIKVCVHVIKCPHTNMIIYVYVRAHIHLGGCGHEILKN